MRHSSVMKGLAAVNVHNQTQHSWSSQQRRLHTQTNAYIGSTAMSGNKHKLVKKKIAVLQLKNKTTAGLMHHWGSHNSGPTQRCAVSTEVLLSCSLWIRPHTSFHQCHLKCQECCHEVLVPCRAAPLIQLKK